jgi:putative transcriptional regulator
MAKRSIFDELMEGVSAMKAHREGKITLRSYKVRPKPLGMP